MASPERGTPCIFEKPCNSSCGRDDNSSMHFTNQVEQSTNGYSINSYEPSYGTDGSLMKFALDISLDLNPKYVIDCLTSQSGSLIADDAPMHLRNDAPSEFANLTPAYIEFSPNLHPSIVQSLSIGPVTVIEERNTNAEWLERELRSFGALSDATQFAVDTPADLQNGFSPVAESASIEITDYFKQEQVESPPAFDRGPSNEQPITTDDVVAVDPSFDTQIPMLLNSNQPRSHITRKYDEEPPYVYRVEGYGEQLSRHENQQEHLEVHSSDQTHASNPDQKSMNNRTLENQAGEEKFACDICRKKFTRHENLKVHMKIHTGEKTFACEICGKNFGRRAYLKSHMVVHGEEKKIKREISGKEFTRDSYFKRPVTFYTEEKKFTCDVCNKSFARVRYLTQHMKVHTDKKEFACDVCNKSFTRVRYLTQHMKVHTDQKEFGCGVCGKTFACKVHLKIHEVVHTKEKKFACDICNMRFGQKATLTRHRAIHTGVQKFACEICNREIARYDNLIAHMRIHRNT